MIAAERLAIVCAISWALGASGCGRYGPPVRANPSNSPAQDAVLFDNARDEAIPYVLDGLGEDVEPETAVEPQRETPAGEGNPTP